MKEFNDMQMICGSKSWPLGGQSGSIFVHNFCLEQLLEATVVVRRSI